MSVIGIDLGNIDCVLAQAKRGGIDILLNENSNRKNPNMVCFNGKHRLIGESAISLARTNFKNTVTDIKKLIGRLYDDPDVLNEISTLPFKCVKLSNGFVGVEILYNNEPTIFTCEQILAMILCKLDKLTALNNENVKSAYCVVSVPGYFTDLQRRGVLNATKIAGMTCLRLINEHTAIALSYGIYKSARNLFDAEKQTYVMFIDMGHTSFTVSIVSFVQGKLQVKSVAYLKIGGRDFDLIIAEKVANEFKSKHNGIDVLKNDKSRIKLLAACEKCKKNLSPQGVTMSTINIECLYDEYDYNGKMELTEFEDLSKHLLNSLENPIKTALQEANIDISSLTDVEIVGGSTRINSVKRKISSILNLDQNKPNYGLSTTLNADEAVARGCALQCAILSPLFKVKEFDIRDIVSYPIEISWDKIDSYNDKDGDSLMTGNKESLNDDNKLIIMSRKDEFPKTKKVNYKHTNDFNIYAKYTIDDSPYLSPYTPKDIGQYRISGIPKQCNEETENDDSPRVRVYMKQDINGLFCVSSGHYMQEIIEEKEVNDEKNAENTTGISTEKNINDENSEMKDDENNKTENNDKIPQSDKEENKEDVKNNKKDDKSSVSQAEPKKKRFRRIDLNIIETVNGMNSSDITLAFEKEVELSNQDRIIEETANKRNELESYIYEMRNNICSKYSEVIKSENKIEFEKKLNEVEDWLYSDDGFDNTKSVYQSKLDELLKYSNPLEYRYNELNHRSEYVTKLKDLIEEYKKKSNDTTEIYDHWTNDERDTIRRECDETEKWLYNQLDAQNKISPLEEPILTLRIISEKQTYLRNVCMPIINKVKPKPKPVPEPVPNHEENNGKDEKANENNNDKEYQKMQDDINTEKNGKEKMDLD